MTPFSYLILLPLSLSNGLFLHLVKKNVSMNLNYIRTLDRSLECSGKISDCYENLNKEKSQTTGLY